MLVYMYITQSEKNAIFKSLQSVQAFEGSLLDETSIINPTFLVKADNIIPYNYLECREFNRYYFIDDVVSVRNGLWRVSCTVDVLMSFRTDILSLECIVEKQENQFQSNPYLNDGSYIADSRVGIEKVEFAGGSRFLDSGQLVLITLGPGGTISGN